MKKEDGEDYPRPGYDVDVEVDAPAYLYHIQTQPPRGKCCN